MFFFFKQKTAYEMRISDWSSDVCSSDLHAAVGKRFRYRYRRRSGSGAAECRHVVARVARRRRNRRPRESRFRATCGREKEMLYQFPTLLAALLTLVSVGTRSEEHTYQLQSLMRRSYDVLCLTKINYTN